MDEEYLAIFGFVVLMAVVLWKVGGKITQPVQTVAGVPLASLLYGPANLIANAAPALLTPPAGLVILETPAAQTTAAPVNLMIGT